MIRKQTIREVFPPHLSAAHYDDTCGQCGFPGLIDLDDSDDGYAWTIDAYDELTFCSRRCAIDYERSAYEAERINRADCGGMS